MYYKLVLSNFGGCFSSEAMLKCVAIKMIHFSKRLFFVLAYLVNYLDQEFEIVVYAF